MPNWGGTVLADDLAGKRRPEEREFIESHVMKLEKGDKIGRVMREESQVALVEKCLR